MTIMSRLAARGTVHGVCASNTSIWQMRTSVYGREVSFRPLVHRACLVTRVQSSRTFVLGSSRRRHNMRSKGFSSTTQASQTQYQPNLEGQDVAISVKPAGKVVGFLGGGQLGRMAALAAANLGVQVICLDPTPNAPASVAAEQVIGDFRNPEQILQFAKQCDVLTVEIEHVDVSSLKNVSRRLGIPVHPAPETIAIIQDKYRQKEHFRAHSIPVVDFFKVSNMPELLEFCEHGYPVMLKARRLAYDGRGNCVIRCKEDVGKAVETLGGFESQLYVEDWVSFKKELAVIVARSNDGTVAAYPVTETVHRDNICFVTETPASVDASVLESATRLAEEAVRCLSGSGIYGVEMFLLEDNSVVVNEVAPRPHNSGHYTIDGCYTSQFEQHIRAVLGWPLGDTSLMVKHAIMLNLLGEAEGVDGLQRAQNSIQKALTIPGAMVHWYEKSNVQKNRKIGHINLVGPSRQHTRQCLRQLSPEGYASLADDAIQESEQDGNEAEVGIVMGSDSDLSTMKAAADVLESFGVPVEVTIVSAHRTPERLLGYAKNAHRRGLKVVIAGAGGAAHLPGMVASLTPLPVIGVPCVPTGTHLDGLDALLSIVQMPKGVPVATVGIGNASNAGLLAVRILGVQDPSHLEGALEHQRRMKETVMGKVERLRSSGWREYGS